MSKKELEWYEINLIIALRIIIPFIRKHNYHIVGIDINSRDGDYIIVDSSFSNYKIYFILNPGFDVLICKKGGIFKKVDEISLVKEKNKYNDFSFLPDNFKNEEDEVELLKGYIKFLETYFII